MGGCAPPSQWFTPLSHPHPFSKVIIALANGVDVGTKEAFMKPLQPVVDANTAALQQCLDGLGEGAAITAELSDGADDAGGDAAAAAVAAAAAAPLDSEAALAAQGAADEGQIAALRGVHTALSRSADRVYEASGTHSPQLCRQVPEHGQSGALVRPCLATTGSSGCI